MSSRLIHADCLEALRGLPDASVDSVVTDPPAGIAFMGKGWDEDKGGRRQWIAWLAEIMGECLRVLKPGGHALVWALPRTSHWTATALEDAGFEVRDCLVHIFGSGFPKSLDVSKAIDKAAGAEREIVGKHPNPSSTRARTAMGDGWQESPDITAPATDAARQWNGWGTALKPASEHWWLCRKPLIGTVAENVQAHGTGALNIDGARVAGKPRTTHAEGNKSAKGIYGTELKERYSYEGPDSRWPPNLLLSHTPECGDTCAEGCAVAEMDRQSGPKKASFVRNRTAGARPFNNDGAPTNYVSEKVEVTETEGGASRFFPVFKYQAKASRSERERGLTAFPERAAPKFDGGDFVRGNDNNAKDQKAKNHHPTVKPIALMRWLARLVTPPDGVVLDPFMGSGTTGVACVEEGFSFIGIEREAEYHAIATARVEHAKKDVPAQAEMFAGEAT